MAGRLAQAAAVEAAGAAGDLLSALDQAGRLAGVPLAPGPMPSDNRRYAAAGHPVVGIGLGAGGYHSPGDSAERVDPGTVHAAVDLVTATAEVVAAHGA